MATDGDGNGDESMDDQVDNKEVRRYGKLLPDQRGCHLQMVSFDGLELQYAGEWKGDPEIVMAAVSSCGDALEFATEELKGDPEIVMAAVSSCGDALEFATEELKGDPDIVMAAILSWRWASFTHPVCHAAEELRGDWEFMMAALSRSKRHCELGLKHATEELRGDRQFLIALPPCSAVMAWATQALRSDPEFVMKVVSQAGAEAVEHASEALRGDYDFMMAVVSQTCEEEAVRHASESLRGDGEFMMAAMLQTSDMALTSLTDELKGDRDFIMAAMSRSGLALLYASQALRTDEKMIDLALADSQVQAAARGLKVHLVGTIASHPSPENQKPLIRFGVDRVAT